MKKILFPFSIIFGLITFIRNLLYNLGVFSSTHFPIKSIVVGNLNTGGTGKSPMVIHLINLLKDEGLVAVLSRGYKRKTKGFQLVKYGSNHNEVGDEPLQFFRNFKNKIIVAVCENRVLGIKKIIEIFKPKILILDDAFQHRKLKADFYILLTDYSKPYYKDYLLPTGNLRESKSQAKRANIIVVTKCPENITEYEKKEIIEKLKPTYNQSVFFSSIKYTDRIKSQEYNLLKEDYKKYDILLITGIAKGEDFYNYCLNEFKTVNYMKFSDHHDFNKNEIKNILKKYYNIQSDNKIILTTEKDYTRLGNFSELYDYIYYMPIETNIEHHELFNNKILEYVRTN